MIRQGAWVTTSWLMLGWLLGLSMLTHFMWLGIPREVIFDEVHFGKFITAYCCTHERFFDIHPPHAKLLIAGTAYLTGFRGGFSFDHIGQAYGAVSPLGLRLLPALAGIALPLVVFVLLRQLGVRPAGAFMGGLVMTLDNALTVQTRVISLDGLLLLAITGSLCAYLQAERSTGRARWRWFALAGALAGLSVGVKFTGLSAPALLAVLLVRRWLGSGSVAQLLGWLTAATVVVGMAVLVYAAGWAVHFGLLYEPGSGDAWRVPQWEDPLAVSFVRETIEWHKMMLDANYGLTAGHPDASAWWEWPLMRSSVFYWQYGGTDARAGSIYFLGNPLVWWGSSALLAALLVSETMTRWRYWRAWWLPLLGYAISFAPLIRVPRALFLYHYLSPLLFAILAVVVWLDARGFFRPGKLGDQRSGYFMAIGALAAFFVVFSPLTYGFLLPPAWYAKLFWLPGWQ
ncbi:MAG: phospholipid carrier-dependent glycosyltransferase [Candidatus Andersenbacteria bacterium]|nr:phospholipid carrier-dependent glycosyltransferase [Candidatus Andersenbacteria bacterium]